MKDEVGRLIMKELFGLTAKSYRYSKDNNNEDEKPKDTKRCVIKRNLKFEDYKNVLDAVQIENEMNHLEKNNVDVDSLKEDQKEFIKHNKLILKILQRLRTETYNAFTEEINKTAITSNDDKRVQPIDSIETYAHGTSKGLAYKKEEIKCNKIIKQYKNVRL